MWECLLRKLNWGGVKKQIINFRLDSIGFCHLQEVKEGSHTKIFNAKLILFIDCACLKCRLLNFLYIKKLKVLEKRIFDGFCLAFLLWGYKQLRSNKSVDYFAIIERLIFKRRLLVTNLLCKSILNKEEKYLKIW